MPARRPTAAATALPAGGPMPPATIEQLLAAKEIVVTRARAVSARRRWPPPSARWPPCASAARCSCSPSTRPAAWPPRSASKRSATSRRRCRPTRSPRRGLEPRGELWAAMLDTKAVVGRPRPPPRPRRRDPRRHPRQPALPEHHRPVRPEPRLHRDGAAARAALARAATTSIVVDTPPSRNALDFLDAPGRMAEFFGSRLLRWLTVPVPVAAVHAGVEALLHDGRPHPRARSSCRTSPSSSSSSRRWRRASSRRGREVSALLGDRRTTFVVVTTLEAAPVRRGRVLRRRAARAPPPPRRAGAQQGAAGVAPRPRSRCRGRPSSRSAPARLAEALAPAVLGRRRPGRATCSPRSARASATSPWSPSARPSSAASWLRRAEVAVTVPYLDERHHRPRGPRPTSASASGPSLADGAPSGDAAH